MSDAVARCGAKIESGSFENRSRGVLRRLGRCSSGRRARRKICKRSSRRHARLKALHRRIFTKLLEKLAQRRFASCGKGAGVARRGASTVRCWGQRNHGIRSRQAIRLRQIVHHGSERDGSDRRRGHIGRQCRGRCCNACRRRRNGGLRSIRGCRSQRVGGGSHWGWYRGQNDAFQQTDIQARIRCSQSFNCRDAIFQPLAGHAADRARGDRGSNGRNCVVAGITSGITSRTTAPEGRGAGAG